MDYNISDAMFRRRLPFGDAVWTGLHAYWTTFHAHDWGFINWDLYGDPSQTYWGVGSDLRAPWPMFHYDLPGNGETALTGPYSPTIAWSRAIATVPTGTLASSPVVGREGQIVVGDANGAVRQYQSGGALQWTYHTGGAIVNAAAISADGTVFVKAQDGKLYAIDKHGVLRWSITEGNSEASPKLAGDGTLYVGGSNGSTYFIDSFQPNGTRTARLTIDARLTTAPAIDSDGTVWFGTANGTLYRANFDLTQPITYPVSPGYPIGNGLALTKVNRTVIVPTANNRVVAYQTSNNTVKWTFVVSDVVQSAPAFASNGQVFFGSRDGKVYAVRFNDGAKLWEFDTGSPIASSPAVDPTSVYIIGGNPATLYALRRADGVLRWSIQVDSASSALGSSPAIGDSSTIYLVARDGALVAVGPYIWLKPPIIAINKRIGPIIIDVQPGDPDPTTLIQVQRRTLGGDWQTLGTFPSDIGQVVDNSVIAGLRYNYRALTLPGGLLKFTSAISEPSDYSPPLEVRASDAIPIAPAAPVVTALSATDLQLTWPPVPTNTAAIAILRQGPGDTEFITVTQVPGSVTATVDSDLLPATTYTYTLRAIGEADVSPSSPGGSGTTLAQTLNPPSNLIVTPLDNTTFEICWQPSNAAYDAVVARQPDGVSTPQVITTVSAGQTCYTDVNLYAGGFTYFVKHRQGSNESAWAQASRAQAPDFAPMVMRYVALPLILKTQ
jgi:outer membrane protein assembly factor BamB